MIKIDETSEVPIYLQVIHGVKRQIMTGIYGPDQRLPSIRELALDLAVNPNTVAKAFQELEREGVIYMRRGQGAFVAATSREDRLRAATTEIGQLVGEIRDLAWSMGIDRTSLLGLIATELDQPGPASERIPTAVVTHPMPANPGTPDPTADGK
jgi:GntR family transcriptional regulator